RQARESATRGVTLPAPVSPTPAQGAARLHRHVADLAAEAALAAHQFPVGDDAAADTRAQGDHHEVVDAASRAPGVLAQGRAIAVVLHVDHLRADGLFEQFR